MIKVAVNTVELAGLERRLYELQSNIGKKPDHLNRLAVDRLIDTVRDWYSRSPIVEVDSGRRS